MATKPESAPERAVLTIMAMVIWCKWATHTLAPAPDQSPERTLAPDESPVTDPAVEPTPFHNPIAPPNKIFFFGGYRSLVDATLVPAPAVQEAMEVQAVAKEV